MSDKEMDKESYELGTLCQCDDARLVSQSREEEFREALLNERAIGYLLYSTEI